MPPMAMRAGSAPRCLIACLRRQRREHLRAQAAVLSHPPPMEEHEQRPRRVAGRHHERLAQTRVHEAAPHNEVRHNSTTPVDGERRTANGERPSDSQHQAGADN
jgi:hypothetical protein